MMDELSKQEPMKQRFKSSYPYKDLNDMHFDDDYGDYGGSFKEIKQSLNHKPHSRAGGRKPQWRDDRKQARKQKDRQRVV